MSVVATPQTSPQRGERISNQIADQIQGDLACPQCQYNLRGLRGAVVHCPECGLECDVAQMVARQWIGPWYNARGFNQIVMPVAWLACMAFILLYVAVVEVEASRGSGVYTFLLALGIFINWLRLLRKSHKQMSDGSGVNLALLAHAIFAGYVTGVIGAGWGIIGGMLQLELGHFIFGIGMVAVMVGLFVVCRRGERYIAEQCLRQYLLRAVPVN